MKLRAAAAVLAAVALTSCGKAGSTGPRPPACPQLPFEGCAAIGRSRCAPQLDAGPGRFDTRFTCGTDGLVAGVTYRGEVYAPLPPSAVVIHGLPVDELLQVGWSSDLLIIRSVGCPRCEAVFGQWEVVQPSRMRDEDLLALQRRLERGAGGLKFLAPDGGVSLKLGDRPLRTLDAWLAAWR